MARETKRTGNCECPDVWTDGTSGRSHLQSASTPFHVTHAPEAPTRELPQAAADHSCRAMVCSPPLTTAKSRNTARNLIYTNQMKIHYTRSIYFLKHRDTILSTYKRRQMKHLKHAFKTLETKLLKTLKSHCKHTQHPEKTFATHV
jgi:hypothetical protein